MFLRPFLICAVFCALFVHSACAEQRIFIDNSGRILKGELISVEGDMVTIKRNDGHVFTVKASMFCASDIDYFRSHGLKMVVVSSAPPSAPVPSDPPPVEEVNANTPGLRAFVSRGQGGLGTRLDRTAHIGTPWGHVFFDMPQESFLLGGFELGQSTHKGGDTLFRSLRCIWLTPVGPQLGEKHGNGKADKILRVLAKPGYAVGAVEGRAGNVLRGMRIVFMRIKGEGLDPADSYKTDFLGSELDGRGTLTGEGQPIVGVYGSAGDDVNQLGLVYERSSTAPFVAANPPTRGGIRGKFYLSIDDAVKIFINGVEIVTVKNAAKLESDELELKPGDRVVAQLTNYSGPRHFLLLFVSSDRHMSIGFQHSNFKILRDLAGVDVTLAQFQELSQYAKPITDMHENPLPFRSSAEFLWGNADHTTLAAWITPDMFKPLPQ